jgi:hypothetical protein
LLDRGFLLGYHISTQLRVIITKGTLMAETRKKKRAGTKGAKKKTAPKAKAKGNPRTGVSLIDAVLKVLAKNPAPMRCCDLVEAAPREGWNPGIGKTPANTLHANIGAEIKREREGGKASRFQKVGRGLFGLASKKYKIPVPKE